MNSYGPVDVASVSRQLQPRLDHFWEQVNALANSQEMPKHLIQDTVW